MAAQKKQDVLVEDGAVYVLRAGASVYVKTADICAMTGKSNQWIGQLLSQGTLNKRSTPHGAMFALTPTVRAYLDMIEARAKASDNKSDKEKNEAEISIKKAKAIVAVIEAKELQGKMHRSEDVEAMTADLIYAVRGVLMSLPGRLAVDVAATTTAAEAADTIRKEVYKAMAELANYRYDPQKYEERVRERRDWDAKNGRDPDDEQ
ncbi:MAG: hypothetical protein LBK75_08620 [Oscillospiraceae bacterium]|nr:hypothetical protein [Oscillospiraceae bacterium]